MESVLACVCVCLYVCELVCFCVCARVCLNVFVRGLLVAQASMAISTAAEKKANPSASRLTDHRVPRVLLLLLPFHPASLGTEASREW